MKKVLLSSAILWLVCYDASADMSVHTDYGVTEEASVEKPYRGYVMAPDYPSEHYDIHTDRHNDYWARHDEKVREDKQHQPYETPDHR